MNGFRLLPEQRRHREGHDPKFQEGSMAGIFELFADADASFRAAVVAGFPAW
jgi:hypothetical protein